MSDSSSKGGLWGKKRLLCLLYRSETELGNEKKNPPKTHNVSFPFVPSFQRKRVLCRF